MRNFGGRIILSILVGTGALLFLMAGGEEMAVPKILEVRFGPPQWVMMVVYAAVFYGCIRLALHYIVQIVRGTKTAHATVMSYYSHTDDDGDVMTSYHFRTDDGEDLVFSSMPWAVLRDKSLNEPLQHKGSRIIVSWYPQSSACKSIRLEQPWTADGEAVPIDTGTRVDGRSDGHVGTTATATRVDETGSARTIHVTLKNSALELQLKPPFLIVWGVTSAAIIAVAIAAYLTSRQLTGMGEQLLIRKMTGGLVVLAAAVMMLAHGIVNQLMIRRYDATHHDVDENATRVSLMRHVAIVVTLAATGIACVHNPAAALIEGPKTEIVTTGSVADADIGTSHEYWMLMVHKAGGGSDGNRLKDYFTVAVPRSHAKEVRDGIERLYGSQEDKPMKLTYWPGGKMDAFDHVEPIDGASSGSGNGSSSGGSTGTNDPTVE
ncbi:hypothetical protein KIH77_06805 [Bifidobacterium sp. 82T24]|uniref:hypothetical protein n=1 Tax=Bifidobacterium pluvialisilvae TaxID=2834436 RepID=UPI001C560069|nr:hypothetical protein [Bifidobacterium pluvialisilvae]MBW3088438.1 hypothetical protein [Bifidobacterium pluvialisilvae]